MITCTHMFFVVAYLFVYLFTYLLMWFSSILWSNIYIYIYRERYDNICALCRCNNFLIQNIQAALPLCGSGHCRKWRDTLRATRDERNWENPRAMMLCSSCMDFPTGNPPGIEKGENEQKRTSFQKSKRNPNTEAK